ncbi:enoyl-CoA hydratase/isomerase family protein [Phenylobacterium immobile]|uniref:enoyl-CoA hydratase/isomerase family protein n=1 Tax=Phenylobacterium immobile TaxID=21 RepID=UPI000AC1EA3A|nr:enoyl-CoA hydratase/isomerase family protein [Phenylobacterium immobile]
MSPSSEPEVIATVEGRAGRIRLNRPRALNALTLAMTLAITRALLAWRDDPAIQVVMIDHMGERGFCAGGDIRALALRSGGRDAVRAFFLHEYRLNHLIFTYPKPVVTFMDGVTMGGGAGLAMPSRFRVATEACLFAMPETAIGFFPDVGAGWFLPRLPGRTGYWLALTSARLGAADCLHLGIATHYMPATALDALKAAIIAGPESPGVILGRRAEDAGAAPIRPVERDIDRAFDQPTIEAILAALPAQKWGRAQAEAIAGRSPFSLKVTLRRMRIGEGQASFAEVMATDYRCALRLASRHDFAEGVRAVIVDKDNRPAWRPADLALVSDHEVASIFANLPSSEEWTALP